MRRDPNRSRDTIRRVIRRLLSMLAGLSLVLCVATVGRRSQAGLPIARSTIDERATETPTLLAAWVMVFLSEYGNEDILVRRRRRARRTHAASSEGVPGVTANSVKIIVRTVA
jgi:hypothetical protein